MMFVRLVLHAVYRSFVKSIELSLLGNSAFVQDSTWLFIQDSINWIPAWHRERDEVFSHNRERGTDGAWGAEWGQGWRICPLSPTCLIAIAIYI